MEQTYADFLAHAPVFLRKEDGSIIYWSRGCQELYGFAPDEAIGTNSHELLNTGFPRPLSEIEAELHEKGEWRGRLRHLTRDGREVWAESLWRLRNAGTLASLVVEQNTDVTERVASERQRTLLARELDHRVRNTLAIVQALARLTFTGVDRAQAEAFEDRLAALSSAHDILVREAWSSARLGEILDEVVEALHIDDRVSCDGPDIRLASNSAVAYALAFHELAVNGLKHGSLRSPEGRVVVRWRLEGQTEDHIRLVWRETGGAPVTPPEREGFGTRLIRRALAAELNTTVELRFEPDGFVCEFAGPVQKDTMGALSSATIF